MECDLTMCKVLPRAPQSESAGAELIGPAPAAKSVREKILENLTSLEIAPGDRITVDGLARRFEVSQTPVREALSRLMGEGLVEKHHLRGYRATDTLSASELENLFSVRALLEEASAEAAAMEATDNHIARLWELHELMQAADGRGDAATFAQLDAEFHDLLAEAARNPFLQENLNRLHVHLHLFRVRSDRDVTGEAIDEHEFILCAVQRRDSVIARAAMSSHIQKSWERLSTVLKETTTTEGECSHSRKDLADD